MYRQRIASVFGCCACASATSVAERMKTEIDSIRSEGFMIISNLQGRRTVSVSTNLSIDTTEALWPDASIENHLQSQQKSLHWCSATERPDDPRIHTNETRRAVYSCGFVDRSYGFLDQALIWTHLVTTAILLRFAVFRVGELI